MERIRRVCVYEVVVGKKFGIFVIAFNESNAMYRAYNVINQSIGKEGNHEDYEGFKKRIVKIDKVAKFDVDMQNCLF